MLVLLVAAVFLPWWGITAVREHAGRMAVELHIPFNQPSLELSLSKKIQYDPQTFVGRGRHAGFWEWSPEGLALTEKGRKFFTDDASSIWGSLTAGRRVLTNLGSVQDVSGGREVGFFYAWSEVSEPIAKLLNDPPAAGKTYRGRAMLVLENGVWRVRSLDTPDYDQAVALLLKEAQGALR